MAETGTHLDVIVAVWHALRGVAERQARTFVGSNQLVYYERGKPSKCFAPDCYVMVQTDMIQPPNILTWVDGVPACIIEVTSKKTRHKDLYDKRLLYQTLGVQEYVLFDPLEDYLIPSLEVNRLKNGEYERQEGDSEGRMALQVLPVELYRGGHWLRVRDRITGKVLPLPDDLPKLMEKAEQERDDAKVLARQERSRAAREKRAAEAERLRAEQERSRAEQAETAVEQERSRAEQERSRAEQERTRAEQAETAVEQERSRAEQERSRAEQAETAVEQERIRAEQERIRAERAEAQLQELQQMLARL